MISIYGINLLLDGETNEDRVLIQDVPATTGINLISPHGSLGMESSGSFEFSIQSDNKYYDAFQQMKTIIYIKYDADVIFFGRVLTVGNELFGARKIVCEGKMSMLLDTWFPPSEEKDRKSITVYQYLRDAISNHNDMTKDSDGPYGVGDYHKYFTLGNVPGNYDPTVSEDQKIENAEYKFGQSSWTQTKNVLEDLKSHYGGCFRVRYLEGYRNYQDLIGQYGEGNIDLNNRIVVYNPDGSFSTERSISIDVDNKIYLIPTVVNGQIVSNDDAINYFFQTNQYLGIFDTNAEADMYAEKLHKRQEWYYGGQPTYFFMNSYLDWYDQYFDVNISAQTIEIGKNLMNMDESTEVDNIFTWIIPVGKSGNGLVYLNGSRRLFVSDLCGIYTDAELNTGYHNADDYRYAMKWYGSIGKVVQFDDKQNPEELKTAAAKWVKDNYHGTISSVTVDAVDMHMIGGAEPQIHVGDRVMLKFPYGKAPNPPIVTRQMTCLEIKYDFYNPEKTQYVFGIPSMALTKNYHSSGSKSKKNASDGSGYNPPTYVPPQENEFDLWFNSLLSWLERHKVWKKSNGGQEGGPNPGDGTRPVFLAIGGSPELDDEGNGKDRLWRPAVSRVVNPINGIYEWAKTNGKPIGAFTAIKHSDLTWKTVNDYHLVEYVRDEYGIDLRQKGNGVSSNMPTVVDNGDGTIDILGGIIGGGSDTSGSPSDLIGKIMSFVGVNGSGTSGEVMKIFNKDGVNIAQLLMNDGSMKFVEIGDDGKPVPDPDHPGEYKFVDIDLRKMYTTTGQLAKDLEDMGITVTTLDDQVTLIGDKVGDNTYGLIYDLAVMGASVTNISTQVINIGDVVGDNTRGLIYDIAAMGESVTSVQTKVNIVGDVVGDNTRGLVYDIAAMGESVTAVQTKVNIVGDVVGDNTRGLVYDIAAMGESVTAVQTKVNIVGDVVGDNTRGLVYDIAAMGESVTAVQTKVNIVGDVVGDNTRGLIYDIAAMGESVTAVQTKVNIVGDVVGDNTRGLVYDLVNMGASVTMLNNAINIINADQLTEEQRQQIEEYAAKGLTVTAIGSDLVTIRGDLSAARAKISSIESDYIKTTRLNAEISKISDRIYVGKAGDLNTGLAVRGSMDVSGTVIGVNASTMIAGFGPGPQGRGIGHVLIGASVDSETNTLTLTALNGDTVTFSKSASAITALLGNWSGNASDANGQLLTVSTSPDTGKTWKIGFGNASSVNSLLGVGRNTDEAVEPSADDPTLLIVPVRIYSELTETPHTKTTRYKTTVPVDASSVYTAGESAGRSTVKISTKWNRNILSYSKSTTGKDSGTIAFGSRFYTYQDQTTFVNKYAIEVITAVDGTTTVVSNTQQYYHLGISNNSSRTALVYMYNDSNNVITYTPHISLASYWDNAYNSAHVTGSWNGNAFTYEKTNEAGTSNSGTVLIGSGVGKDSTPGVQDDKIYAYASHWTASSTTPVIIASSKKELTIVDVADDNNKVKLQANGNDTGLTYTHNKFTSGYSSAHVTGSWNGNAFTYEKTNAAGTSNSGTVLVGNTIGKNPNGDPQDAKIYSYTTHWSASATTPVGIDSTKKELTIVDVADDNNKVKLQANGNDTGLIYAHNKFTAGYNSGYNSAHVSGSWTNNSFTYQKVSTSGAADSGSVSVGVSVGRDPNGDPSATNPDYYAYTTTWNASATTPVAINTAQTKKKLTITDKDNNTVKLQANGSDTGLTYAHNKFTAGYDSAHVTGSWNGNAFTYEKTNAAGTYNSGAVLIGSGVGKDTTPGTQDTKIYAYASHWTASATTPVIIASSKRELTIVDVENDNNKVKLQANGNDTGLTYTHNKYTAGTEYGKTIASITESWDRSNPSSTANPIDTLNIKREGTTVKSHLMSAGVGLSYNTSTHKYTATARAKVDDTERGATSSTTSGTEAYDAGTAYGKTIASITESWDRSNPSSTANPIDTLNIKREGTTVKSHLMSAAVGLSYDTSTHKYTATARAKVDGTERGAASSTTSGTEAYDAGNTNGQKSVTPTDIAWISSGSYFETHNPKDSGKTVGEAVQLIWRTASSKYYVTLQSRKNGTQNSWNNRISSEYKLGLSGTKVQVQDSSGTKLSNTPEYTIPLTTKDITSNGTYTPGTGYVGFSSVKVNIPAESHSPYVIDNTVYAVSTEPKSSDGYAPVSGPVIDSNGHWCQFSVRCGSTTNKYKFSIDATAYGTASYNSGYGAAHVTGSWSNNAFTYTKTTSGSSNSGTVLVGSYVGRDPNGDPQDSTVYALTQKWTSSAPTPVTISNTKRALSIANVSDNSVKLQSGGSDTPLTFYHGKYDAGYNSGRDYAWGRAVSSDNLDFSYATNTNYIWFKYPTASFNTSEQAYFWLVDNTTDHCVDLWLGNYAGGTYSKWATKAYSVPTPPYTMSTPVAGHATTTQATGELAGYTIKSATLVASQQNYYRYVRFTVDGHKYAIFIYLP